MEEKNSMECVVPIVATEAAPAEQAIAELDRRMREIEVAIGGLTAVRASESQTGRKTQVAMAATGAASVDEALLSLSVEQRIAVKSGLMRAGLLL